MRLATIDKIQVYQKIFIKKRERLFAAKTLSIYFLNTISCIPFVLLFTFTTSTLFISFPSGSRPRDDGGDASRGGQSPRDADPARLARATTAGGSHQRRHHLATTRPEQRAQGGDIQTGAQETYANG